VSSATPDGPDGLDGLEPRLVGRRSHREPRYAAFLVVGAALGVLLAVVLTFARPESDFGRAAVLGYLAVLLGAAGALVAGTVAAVIGLVIDLRHRSR